MNDFNWCLSLLYDLTEFKEEFKILKQNQFFFIQALLLTLEHYHMNHTMRKPDFCICKNKGADQLSSNCEADQRLCFRYSDSTIEFLFYLYPKFQATSLRLWLYSPVCVGPGRKPGRPVFLHRGSYEYDIISSALCMKYIIFLKNYNFISV